MRFCVYGSYAPDKMYTSCEGSSQPPLLVQAIYDGSREGTGVRTPSHGKSQVLQVSIGISIRTPPPWNSLDPPHQMGSIFFISWNTENSVKRSPLKYKLRTKKKIKKNVSFFFVGLNSPLTSIDNGSDQL